MEESIDYEEAHEALLKVKHHWGGSTWRLVLTTLRSLIGVPISDVDDHIQAEVERRMAREESESCCSMLVMLTQYAYDAISRYSVDVQQAVLDNMLDALAEGQYAMNVLPGLVDPVCEVYEHCDEKTHFLIGSLLIFLQAHPDNWLASLDESSLGEALRKRVFWSEDHVVSRLADFENAPKFDVVVKAVRMSIALRSLA